MFPGDSWGFVQCSSVKILGTCTASEMVRFCYRVKGTPPVQPLQAGPTHAAAHRTVTIPTPSFSPGRRPCFRPPCIPGPSLARLVHHQHPAATACIGCWSPPASGPHRYRGRSRWTFRVAPATGSSTASGVERQRWHTGDQLHGFSLNARHGFRLGGHDYFPTVVQTVPLLLSNTPPSTAARTGALLHRHGDGSCKERVLVGGVLCCRHSTVVLVATVVAKRGGNVKGNCSDTARAMLFVSSAVGRTHARRKKNAGQQNLKRLSPRESIATSGLVPQWTVANQQMRRRRKCSSGLAAEERRSARVGLLGQHRGRRNCCLRISSG